MTQKEIDKFLANTKVYVNCKSKDIQEKLFSLGYYWSVGKGKEVIYEDKPFLYVSKDYNITYGCDMCAFIQHKHREMSAEEILSIELTKPTYRPFKNLEECWNEMLKHQPFGWVKYKETGTYIMISTIYSTTTDHLLHVTNPQEVSIDCCEYSFSGTFDNFCFADDTPFGVKEN